MRGLMGSGYRTSCPIPLARSREFGISRRALLIQRFYSKIFPPTPEPEDLPTREEPAEAGAATAKPSTGEASAVSKDTSTGEPEPKKLKTSVEDLGNDDWEAVEKPTEATSDQAADTTNEGEKVEAIELGGSDGEKVEKPVAEQNEGTGASVGHSQPENMLAKDW